MIYRLFSPLSAEKFSIFTIVSVTDLQSNTNLLDESRKKHTLATYFRAFRAFCGFQKIHF
jgi:hypothetical protein